MTEPKQPEDPPAKSPDHGTGIPDGMQDVEPKGTPTPDRQKTETTPAR